MPNNKNRGRPHAASLFPRAARTSSPLHLPRSQPHPSPARALLARARSPPCGCQCGLGKPSAGAWSSMCLMSRGRSRCAAGIESNFPSARSAEPSSTKAGGPTVILTDHVYWIGLGMVAEDAPISMKMAPYSERRWYLTWYTRGTSRLAPAR